MIRVGSRDQGESALADMAPDLTPMLDILFILLLFFMLTAGAVFQSLNLTLPSSVAEDLTLAHTPDHILLEIRTGSFALDGREIKGFETTRLGHRHRSEDVIPLEDPRGRQFYWIGAPGGEEDNGPGTDFNAIRRGYVSVTPIHVDLTRYQALDPVGQWVQNIRIDEDAA